MPNPGRSKKILIIVAVVIVIVAVLVGAYFGLRKSQQVIFVPGIGSLPIGGGGQPTGRTSDGVDKEPGLTQDIEQQKQRLTALSSKPVVDFWVVWDGSTSTVPQVLYIDSKGEVGHIVNPGEEKTITTSSFGTPLKVVQNIDGSRVITAFDSGTYALFDTAGGAWQNLGMGIEAVAFAPDGERFAYLNREGTKVSLIIDDFSKGASKLTRVASLALQDFGLLWPHPDNIMLMPKMSYRVFDRMWAFDLSTKQLSQLDAGKALGYVFSPDMSLGLRFESADPSRLTTTVVDADGRRSNALPFSTLPDKCVFDWFEPAAYCAVPYSFNKEFSLRLPDDYYMHAVYFNDDLYKITINTDGETFTPVFNVPSVTLDAVHLKIAGPYLFFLNRLDQKVYRLELAPQGQSPQESSY